MSEDFSYSERHLPRVTSTVVLWTMAAVVVAGTALLVLAMPAPGDTLDIADAGPVSVSPTGEVDQSSLRAPTVDRALPAPRR